MLDSINPSVIHVSQEFLLLADAIVSEDRIIHTPNLWHVLMRSFDGEELAYYRLLLAKILKSYESPLKSQTAKSFSVETTRVLSSLFALPRDELLIIKQTLVDNFKESFPDESSVDTYIEWIKSKMNPEDQAGPYAKIMILLLKDALNEHPVFSKETPLAEFNAQIDLMTAEEKTKLNSLAIQVNNVADFEHAWKIILVYRGILKRLSEVEEWSNANKVVERLAGCVTDVAGAHFSPQRRFSNDTILENFYSMLKHLHAILKEPFYFPSPPSARIQHLQKLVSNLHEKPLGFPAYELPLKESIDRISILSEIYLKYETPLSEGEIHSCLKEYLASAFGRPLGFSFEDDYGLIWAMYKTGPANAYQSLYSKIAEFNRVGPNLTMNISTRWSVIMMGYDNNRMKSGQVNAIKSIKTTQTIFKFLRERSPDRITIQHIFSHEVLYQAKKEAGLNLDTAQEMNLSALVRHFFKQNTPIQQILAEFKKGNPFAMGEDELANDTELCQILIALLKYTIFNAPEPKRTPLHYFAYIVALEEIKKNASLAPVEKKSTSQPLLTQAPNPGQIKKPLTERQLYLSTALVIYNAEIEKESRVSMHMAIAEKRIKGYFKNSQEKNPDETIQTFLADYFTFHEAYHTPPVSPFYQVLTPFLSEDFFDDIQLCHGDKIEKLTLKLKEAHEHLRSKNLFSIPEADLTHDKLCNKVIHDLLISYFLNVRVPGNTHRLTITRDTLKWLNVEPLCDLPVIGRQSRGKSIK
jgi:hypothetical protein